MKITGYGTVRQANASRRKGGASVAGDFATLLGRVEAGAMDAAAPLANVASVPLLGALAAQEVTSDDRRQVLREAESALDRLEALRMALLSGRVPRDLLGALQRHIDTQRGAFPDPRLQSLLDDIDLRVAVELAKLEWQGKS